MNCNNFSRVHKHFIFESVWLVNGNYNERIKWLRREDENVAMNLRNIQAYIQEWKCSTLNQIHRGEKEIMDRLNGVQM